MDATSLDYADATGIPLDELLLKMSVQVREEFDLARFGSSANTPGQKRRAAS